MEVILQVLKSESLEFVTFSDRPRIPMVRYAFPRVVRIHTQRRNIFTVWEYRT